jgi:ubiquitin C-terminal hydrolase
MNEQSNNHEVNDENNNINNSNNSNNNDINQGNLNLAKDENAPTKEEEQINDRNNFNDILNNEFSDKNSLMNDDFNLDENHNEKDDNNNDIKDNIVNNNISPNIEDNSIKKQDSQNVKKSIYKSIDTMKYYNSKDDNEEDFDINENNNNLNTIEVVKEEDDNNNIEYNIDDIKEELFVEEYNPSLGLNKQENPNYMNAILQCLAHIPEISEKIINLHVDPDFQNIYQNLKLTKTYREVLINILLPEKVLNLNKRPYNTKKFRDIIRDLNPAFQSEKYIDYKQFLIFLINRLHDELNTNKNNQNQNSDLNLSTNSMESIDIQNENDALIVFLKKFTNKNDSIIVKNLYGITKYNLYCHKCQHSFYNYQCYSYFYFNISNIISNKQSKFNKSDIDLNIFDCFDYYQKPETLLGDKALFCPKCKEYNESTSIKNIYSTKNILILMFDNFKENIENIIFDYTESLNLRDYVQFKKDEKKNKEKFYLCGIVNFVEDTYGNETFNAFCRVGKKSDWYCYDNENIYPVTFEEIKNNGFPVILFYHKLVRK